jgi:hypothetical protein
MQGVACLIIQIGGPGYGVKNETNIVVLEGGSYVFNWLHFNGLIFHGLLYELMFWSLRPNLVFKMKTFCDIGFQRVVCKWWKKQVNALVE